MLEFLFIICILWGSGKLLIFGMKAAWGISKLLLSAIFLPVILIGMVIGGLMYLVLPIFIIGGIIFWVVKKSLF